MSYLWGEMSGGLLSRGDSVRGIMSRSDDVCNRSTIPMHPRADVDRRYRCPIDLKLQKKRVLIGLSQYRRAFRKRVAYEKQVCVSCLGKNTEIYIELVEDWFATADAAGQP